MSMPRQIPSSAAPGSPSGIAVTLKNKTARRIIVVMLAFVVGVLLAGTWRNPHFWLTPDQEGERWSEEKHYAEAAKVYTDPWRIGVAQYRDGAFEAAAKTFARVPGADGAFDQGNAWLMRGNYAAAVASYDRALGFHPGWKEAEENKALALARQKMLKDSNQDAGEEQADDDDPGKIVFDLKKGEDRSGKPVELAEGKLSEEQMRALWLRRVQTTPGDFLRAKFAYQTAADETGAGE
jgi:Ca-activated chloride channel homolog